MAWNGIHLNVGWKNRKFESNVSQPPEILFTSMLNLNTNSQMYIYFTRKLKIYNEFYELDKVPSGGRYTCTSAIAFWEAHDLDLKCQAPVQGSC